MNQQQNQSQGGQSQGQGQNQGRGQQQQGLSDPGGQGKHLIDEDDGIPGSDEDAGAERARQHEQSDSNRKQQDDKPRTGSEAERI